MNGASTISITRRHVQRLAVWWLSNPFELLANIEDFPAWISKTDGLA